MNIDHIAPVRRWIEQVVVGHDLCPFARPVLDRVRYVVSEARDLEALLTDLAAELEALVNAAPARRPTTVLVVPHMLADFSDYLDAVELVDAVLADSGLEGEVQVASFHPEYRFADAPADDPAHYTNRSPYPLLHLLREDEVSRAVDAHPDVEAIPERNVAHFRALGLEAVRALLDDARRGDPQPSSRG